MKSTGKYFLKLEKKSSGLLIKGQLNDSAMHVHYKYFKDSPDSIIIFCNSDYKSKVKRNYYLKLLIKDKSHALVYSKIVPSDCSLKKRKVFYVFRVNNINGNYEVKWSKEFPIKMNQCFNVLKIINSGRPIIEETALMSAKFLKLYTGGIAPINYNTTLGLNRNLGINFGLTESNIGNKDEVIKQNIEIADAILYVGSNRNDFRKMQRLADKCNKPMFHLTLSDVERLYSSVDGNKSELGKVKLNYIDWIIKNKIKSINVTGFSPISELMRKKVFSALIRLISKNEIGSDRINKKYSIIKSMVYEETCKAEK